MVVLKGPNFGGPMDQIWWSHGPNFGGPMDQSFVDRCYILGGCTCAWTGLIFNKGLAGSGQQGGLYSSLFYGLLWGSWFSLYLSFYSSFPGVFFSLENLINILGGHFKIMTSFLHAVHFLIFLFCL